MQVTGASDNSLAELKAFRKKLEAWARRQLEQTNPAYLQAFSARLVETGSPSRAIEQTRALLGSPPRWYRLLTAMADIEIALDKVRRALSYLGAAPANGMGQLSNEGAWAVYHFDQWTFQMHALLERLERLIKLTGRHIASKKNPKWPDAERTLLDRVKGMSDVVGNVRHPLAHGGGGGVKGLEDDRLWEPYLVGAMGLDIDFPQALYQAVGESGRREKWGHYLQRSTVLAIRSMEEIFERLSSQAFGDS